MQTTIEQIKDRIDIVDLIQEYVRLQKAGVNYKALCPFHNEKTPSFIVSPDKQIWRCFGCGKGGDIFAFIQEMEGVEFPEALRILAKKAGVELKHFDKNLQTEKNKLYEICNLASKFFEKQLWESDTGKRALRYLTERGLKEQTIKFWRLGYAPNTWNSLRTFLRNAGWSNEDIFKSGLAVKKEEAAQADYQVLSESRYYDRFRGRIMFPVFDLNNQVVGFSGRVFEDPVIKPTELKVKQLEAKYINTPQTPIYDKSRILYGLNFAKMDIKKNDRVIIVEGNMDVIMSSQAGVKNVVATSGTALTAQHLKILKRYTENLDFCFDADQAGETATERGWEMALAAGLNTGVILVSADRVSIDNEDVATDRQEIKDVADLVNFDAGAWQKISKESKPIIQFFIDSALKMNDLGTVLGKKNVAKAILPKVKMIGNRIEQVHWLNVLAMKLGIDEKILAEEMNNIKSKATTTNLNNREEDQQKTDPALEFEETILALLLKRPESAKKFFIDDEAENMVKLDLHKRILDYIISVSDFDYSKMLESFPYEDRLKIELIKFKSDQLFNNAGEYDIEAEIARTINNFKKEHIKEKIKKLEIKLRELQAAGKSEEAVLVLKEVSELGKQLN